MVAVMTEIPGVSPFPLKNKFRPYCGDAQGKILCPSPQPDAPKTENV